jgi:glycosyltransferase involved in cell wall biosynthesis
MLHQLPAPPQGKTGWPWTEESEIISAFQDDGKPWPRISIVTPSYNQGQFLEETIRSILLQNYPNLEYIVVDGKSSDNSIEIIRKYQDWISYWVSESDLGQSHAINKGFDKCTGSLVNWICSDDILSKNALNHFIKKTELKPYTLYLGNWSLMNERSDIIKSGENVIVNLEMLANISGFWRNGASISQQSALYNLESVRKVNGLNLSNYYTMDYDLWGKLLLTGCTIQNVPVPIGVFRVYPEQKTAMRFWVTLSLVRSSVQLISKSRLTAKSKIILTIKDANYLFWFIYHHLRSVLGLKRRYRKVWRKK